MIHSFAMRSMLGLLSVVSLADGHAAADPVVLSFAFVGCNRLDGAGVKATSIASTANEAQLLRTFADVAALNPVPQLMILAGDIVKAKKAGTKDLESQLSAWQKLVHEQLPRTTRLVAFTGNHELLKPRSDSDATEIPNQPAYGYWQGRMGAYIAGSDGPDAGGADHLLNAETSLSYTFSSGRTLFIVLNTDSQIDSTTTGNVPLNWLAGKLAAAQRDPGIDHVFVMGHKPIVVPGKAPDDGVKTIRSAQGPGLYELLNQGSPGAPSKVRAYLAAHAHQWSFANDMPYAPATGGVPQIIAGNGGSPPEKSWPDGGHYFGYTLVQVTAGGRVTAQSYGRPIPQRKRYYLQAPPPPPATPQGAQLVLKP